MAFLAQLWLPIVLSAVLVFFVSALFWMISPHHQMEWKKLPNEDIIATLTRFTPLSITKAVTELVGDISGVDTLIASGGGTRNPVLMAHLREDLGAHGIRLTTSDEYGIPPQFKEAIKFGTLAFANMNLLANNIPACSGATAFAVMGKVQWPPQMVRAFPDPGEKAAIPADVRPSAR